MAEALMEVEGLAKHYAVSAGGRGRTSLRAVDGISFTIEEGKTFGLVGESGSGKTTTGKIILGLEKPSAGRVRFMGSDLASLTGERYREYRRNVQAVFQDPVASMNPRLRVRSIIAEPLVVNGVSRADITVRVRYLLGKVGLPERSMELFPHEFSGGQRQRIAIARSLALEPKLIVLDEAVSALDVSIRAQILNLLVDLQRDLGMAYFFIAHDLSAVAHMSHTIAVMYLGKIVEMGEAQALVAAPQHSYTQALFSAVLPAENEREARRRVDR